MADDATARDRCATARRRPGARLRRCPISLTTPRFDASATPRERKGIALEVSTFSESTHTAADAAAALGAELGQIVKSLVFVVPADDGALEPVLCLVSGVNRVDMARLAAVIGEPSIRRASAREANDLTGFTIGGIPPIGHAKPLRVVMDPDLGRYETVWAAAGLPNAVFPVPPATLRILSNATVAPIAEVVRQADLEAALGG